MAKYLFLVGTLVMAFSAFVQGSEHNADGYHSAIEAALVSMFLFQWASVGELHDLLDESRKTAPEESQAS